MKSLIKKHWLSIVFAVLSIICMAVCWIIAWKAEGNELVVPSPVKSLQSFFALFAEKYFWSSLGLTLLRTLSAVAISFVLAMLCAVIGVAYAPFKAFFAPVIAVCRVVPTMAVTLILILAFPSDITPVIVTLLVIFPMLYATITASIEGLDKGLLDMAKTYSLSRKTTLSKIVLPQIAPEILFQLGTVISFALKITISAEVIAFAYHGIGGMIKTANYWIEIARMSALTLVSVIVGLIIELVFFIINKNTFKWRRADANK
ncbi:MAG: ABC transporter permease [Candidatus Coproplasma sp.]